MSDESTDVDKVSRIIRHCIEDHQFAEKTFGDLTTGNRRLVQLPEGTVILDEEEVGEFVERYSGEVEPTIWESKRLKY